MRVAAISRREVERRTAPQRELRMAKICGDNVITRVSVPSAAIRPRSRRKNVNEIVAEFSRSHVTLHYIALPQLSAAPRQRYVDIICPDMLCLARAAILLRRRRVFALLLPLFIVISGVYGR